MSATVRSKVGRRGKTANRRCGSHLQRLHQEIGGSRLVDLKAVGDPREVVRDPEARYWGGRVDEHSLVPLGETRIGRSGLDEWLRRSPMSDRTPALWQPRQYGEWKRTEQSCGPHPGFLRPMPLRRQPLSGMRAKEGKREVEKRSH